MGAQGWNINKILLKILVFAGVGGFVSGAVLGPVTKYAVLLLLWGFRWVGKVAGLGGSRGYKTHCWVLR